MGGSVAVYLVSMPIQAFGSAGARSERSLLRSYYCLLNTPLVTPVLEAVVEGVTCYVTMVRLGAGKQSCERFKHGCAADGTHPAIPIRRVERNRQTALPGIIA